MKSPTVSYRARIIGQANHASFEIPDEIITKLGTNKRAPLKITVNGHTYQSTATGVGGKCMVVFPTRDREASGTKAGDEVTVILELDDGYRDVEIPVELARALKANQLYEVFHALVYSRRREFARQISEARTEETRDRRISRVIDALKDIDTAHR